MFRTARRAATALIAGVTVLTGAGVAQAAITGNATAAQSLTSAGWGAKPTANDGTSTLSLTWDSISGTLAAVRYFRIVNTGSAALTAANYTFTVNRVLNNGNNVPPTNFDVCVGGTFNTLTGLCSTNNIVTVGATTSSKFSVAVTSTQVPAVGGSLSMRAAPQSSNFSQPFAATVDAAVSATQIRADRTVNS